MDAQSVFCAVTPARARDSHAAIFEPGSTSGRVLCNDKPVGLPLVKLPLYMVSCDKCQAELDLYER